MSCSKVQSGYMKRLKYHGSCFSKLISWAQYYSPGEGKVFKMIFACEISACVQDPAETVFGRTALL